MDRPNAAPDPQGGPHGQPFEIADLLVRCSGVPLARIAAVLGFAGLERFAEWFEHRAGEHPEVVRAAWEVLQSAPASPEADVPDGPDEQQLALTRRLLFSVLDGRETAYMIRALRSRRPITPERR